MNEPHENLDHDPFADDASRQPSRLRRAVARQSRPRCRGARAPMALKARRQTRTCTNAARGPLR
jgi:hypothetical protein